MDLWKPKSPSVQRVLAYLLISASIIVIFLLTISTPLSPTSNFNQTITAMNGSEKKSQHNGTSTTSNSTINAEQEQPKKELEPETLRKVIMRINQEGKVQNLEKFGPLADDDLVIVVQVHNRPDHLAKLLESLSKSRGIAKALLVLSHDFYSDDINQVVAKVDFCKYVQIFYPYSIQTHPTGFPGLDSNDCDSSVDKKHAVSKGCKNALYTDTYGHYRTPELVQIKMHWWWKANVVFKGLVKDHKGLKLFLEDDHYVVEDFIHVLDLMKKNEGNWCQYCMYSIGVHNQQFTLKVKPPKVRLSNQMSNFGLAFNSTVWASLASCSEEFCKYDDYNWDWSFQKMLQSCVANSMTAVNLQTSRIVHLGECGVHHTSSECHPQKALDKYRAEMESAKEFLFPKEVVMAGRDGNVKKVFKNFGGFGDPRDQSLCLGISRI